MTNEELLKEHIKEKCKYCRRKDCGGITITNDRKTRCEVDYE